MCRKWLPLGQGRLHSASAGDRANCAREVLHKRLDPIASQADQLGRLSRQRKHKLQQLPSARRKLLPFCRNNAPLIIRRMPAQEAAVPCPHSG